MIMLQSNVINLAVTHIQKDFGVALSAVEWINNGYLLAGSAQTLSFVICGSVIEGVGTFFLIPVFLQGVLGFSAIKTGFALLPLALEGTWYVSQGTYADGTLEKELDFAFKAGTMINPMSVKNAKGATQIGGDKGTFKDLTLKKKWTGAGDVRPEEGRASGGDDPSANAFSASRFLAFPIHHSTDSY